MARFLVAVLLTLLWASGAYAQATETPTQTATPTATNTPAMTPVISAATTDGTFKVWNTGPTRGAGRKTVMFINTSGTVTANVNCAVVGGAALGELYTVDLTTGDAGQQAYVFEHYCEVIELEAASCSSCSLSAWLVVERKR